MMKLLLTFLFSVLFLSNCATRSFVRDEVQKVRVVAEENRSGIIRVEENFEAIEIETDRALALADYVLWKSNVAVTEFVTYLSKREIYFAFDSYGFDKKAVSVLAEVGRLLRLNPEYELTVEGHTDNIASNVYNQDLGRRRVESVEKYLVERFDIPLHRIFSLTFGESAPKASNATSAGRAENRRVVLQVWCPVKE